MKRKKISWVLGAMALALLLCVPSISRSLAVDLSENCSLSFKMLPEFADDLDTKDILVDVYQVAIAVEDPNYDSYSFEAKPDFDALAKPLENLQTVNYAALSQVAAQTVVEKGIQPDATVSAKESVDLAPGLYLTMPRNENKSFEESMENVMVEGVNNVVTTVNTAQYKYTFNPAMVALPSRMVSDTNNNTANNDLPWQYDFEMTLKSSQARRDDGSLVINKNVDRYGGSGEQSFVFEIKITPVEGEAYTRYEWIRLEEGSTSGSVTVDRIPAGATVEVSEKYTGTNYEYVSGDDSQVVEDADVVLEFDFENKLVENHKHGSSVNNKFSASENGGWNVRQEGLE